MGASPCFHCGEPVPEAAPVFAVLGNVQQPVCCLGCKAVAEFIHDSGFDAFYRHRSNPQAELGLRAEPSDYSIYDEPDLRDRYVHNDGDSATATIGIGGMYCSACVWLLDNALSRLDGIQAVSVNSAGHRALIQWDDTKLSFSGLLAAIARVGFKPSPASPGLADDAGHAERKTALRRLIVAAAAGMQVMSFAVALYAGDYYGIEPQMEKFLRLISLLVCLPIIAYSARPFFAGAWRGLRARAPGMDLPVALAISAAFLASAWAVIVDRGQIYFDSVAMFVLFLSATRYLEMRVRHSSEDHTRALARLLPETVTRICDGQPQVVALDRLRVDDVVLLRPGDVIPADGTVLSGSIAVDESLLTGESLPVPRREGMPVFAGGVNRSGNASVRITLTGASTSLAEVGRLLERAKADRPPVAQLADRIASRFVSGVLLLAALTGIAWLRLDPARAFEVVLATLVVTCPCALSLATPAAIAAATSRLARDGFMLVRSRVLDVLSRRPTLVFDKTGTLTSGRPAIVGTQVFGRGAAVGPDALLAMAAALETASEHVLARAFASRFEAGRHAVTEVDTIAGGGVQAIADGKRWRIGSADFVGVAGSEPSMSGDEAHTQVFLSADGELLARFDIGDELRADAPEAVSELQSMGYEVSVASGDREVVVRAVAKKLGIHDWHASLTPAGKVSLVRRLQAAGREVVMVGDGVNDAPVLAAANASIAIDAGTALARASADAIVLGKRLLSVVDGVALAAATRRVIRQNIGWAIAYNLVAVPLAASGQLAPWMAAIGMSASSLVVVLNALRLQRVDTSVARESSVSRKGETGEALV